MDDDSENMFHVLVFNPNAGPETDKIKSYIDAKHSSPPSHPHSASRTHTHSEADTANKL